MDAMQGYRKAQDDFDAVLAAVRPDERQAESPSTLFRPRIVGLETLLTPTMTGTLYLKINDSPAELADNAGTLEVEVTLASP